jgi:hypothetical protein
MNKKLLQLFGGIVSLLALISGCLLVISQVLRGEWKEVLSPLPWILGFVMVLLLIQLLFPKLSLWFSHTIEAGYEAFLKFLFHYFLVLLPIFLFSRLSTLLVALNILWVQIMILTLWGALLFYSIRVIVYEKNRIRFFNWLRDQMSGFVPWAYSFVLFMIGVYFFASLTYILVAGNSTSLITPSFDETTLDTYLEFYTWHFLDAIPGFAVTDTLQWKEPLIYDSQWIGFIVLTFKVIIISPIIGSFIWYWRFIGKEEEKETRKQIRKTVYHTYRPKRSTLR